MMADKEAKEVKDAKDAKVANDSLLEATEATDAVTMSLQENNEETKLPVVSIPSWHLVLITPALGDHCSPAKPMTEKEFVHGAGKSLVVTCCLFVFISISII